MVNVAKKNVHQWMYSKKNTSGNAARASIIKKRALRAESRQCVSAVTAMLPPDNSKKVMISLTVTKYTQFV